MTKVDESRSQSYLCKTGRANIFQSRRPWIDFCLYAGSAAFFSFLIGNVVRMEFGTLPAIVTAVTITLFLSAGAGVLLRFAAIEAQEAEAAHRLWVSNRESVGDTFEVRTGWNTFLAWGFVFTAPIIVLMGWLLDIQFPMAFLSIFCLAFGFYIRERSGAIRVTSDGIQFVSRQGTFKISRDDVTLVETHIGDRFILFYSDRVRLRIPGYPLWSGTDKHTLRFFLDELIPTLNIPISALTKGKSEASKVLSDNDEVPIAVSPVDWADSQFVVEMKFHKIVSVLGVIFFTVMLFCLPVVWFMDESVSRDWILWSILAAGALFVFLPCIYAYSGWFLHAGTLILNREKIHYECRAGIFEVAWVDIVSVATSKPMESIELVTHSGRLAVPAPRYWGGKEKKAAREFFHTQIGKRKVPMRSDWRVGWRFSKGVRVDEEKAG